MKTLAILAYHKIGPAPGGWETWNYVPEHVFEEHLNVLRDGGWEVISVTRFLLGLAEPDSLPQRAAMITFDDGYRSTLTIAAPCLRRFQYPAVVFVPTGFIGGSNSFDADCEPEEAICDFSDLCALEEAHVSVQSHGVGHRALSALGTPELEEELCRSRDALQEALNKRVELYAYPYGDSGADPDAAATALINAGYVAAFLYGGGPGSVPIVAPYQIPRLAMGPDSDLKAALTVAQEGK